MSTRERYVLATGDDGAHRLQVVQDVHGPDSQSFLKRAGLRPGMRVADIGCGTGILSRWLADQVGPTGSVVGVDVSEGQVATARQNAAGRTNLNFRTASAYSTGLDRSGFDLVFCRFLLMHCARPMDAIHEMASLVTNGGILACEDGDFTSPFAEPHVPAYARCFELYRAAVAARGADARVGPKLYRMFLDAGFSDPTVTLAQSIYERGDAKRLPEWTLAECAPALLEHGVTTQEEIDRIVSDLQAQARDETTLFAMVQVTQIWARK